SARSAEGQTPRASRRDRAAHPNGPVPDAVREPGRDDRSAGAGGRPRRNRGSRQRPGRRESPWHHRVAADPPPAQGDLGSRRAYADRARGTFVEEPLGGPGNKAVRGQNGRIVRRRVWKRGRLEPFHAIDLAPGQIVMVLLQGVWHMDCHPVTVGATTPPRSFPVRYSFLWKTTTTQIPLPGGLTIAPPNRHPYTDCHGGRGMPTT